MKQWTCREPVENSCYMNMDIQVTDGFDKFKECVLNAIQKEQDK